MLVRHIGERVFAHEVVAIRLVGGGGEPARFRQQLCLQRKQVAENAGQRDHHVDARTAEFRERDQRRAAQAAVGVEARLGADPGERLTDRPAFALEIVGAPQHQRDRFRHALPSSR